MKNEIEKLIVKYEDKSLEEPDYYFQWEEIIEDLKSLLGKSPEPYSIEEVKNEYTKDKAE